MQFRSGTSSIGILDLGRQVMNFQNPSMNLLLLYDGHL